MKRNLSDPVLGVLVSDIKEAFEYKVIDGTAESDLFQASVYQHPELVRSDAGDYLSRVHAIRKQNHRKYSASLGSAGLKGDVALPAK